MARRYGKKVTRAVFFTAALIFPAFLTSLIAPFEVSGSTSGNHFTITNEAGAIGFYGWFLESVFPISGWDLNFEKLDRVSKDDWGGITEMLGLDFVLHLDGLQAAVPYWLIATLVFLIWVIVLFILSPNPENSSEQSAPRTS